MLVDLGNALHYTGDSIIKLREAVDGYFCTIDTAMENKIDEFRQKLEQAQAVLSAARSALSACMDSRYYDYEKEEWVEPNCSCEERDVADAEKEVSRINTIIEKLERIKSDIDREFYEYRQPFGIITPGGGDGVLEWLGETHTKDSTEMMDRILEVVEKYLRTSVGKNSSIQPISRTLPDMECSVNSIPHEKKEDQFRRGIERIAERQSSENHGDHKLHENDAIALCSHCHRPIIACTCGMETRERYRIFNYDLSR